LRRAADLEHWASFRASFDRLAGLLAEVSGRSADGGPAGTRAPRSVTVLSGDVHHSYVARVRRPGAPVHQVTCSPLHNHVSRPIRWAFRMSWGRPADLVARALFGRLARVPRPSVRWHGVGGGPWFGNAIATVTLDGPAARLTIESSEQPPGAPPLRVLTTLALTPPGPR
jgi:hypothetical protein